MNPQRIYFKYAYISLGSVYSNCTLKIQNLIVCETCESLNKRFSTLYITEHTCPMLPAYFKTNHNGLLTVGHIPELLMTLLPNNILQGFNYRTYASLVHNIFSCDFINDKLFENDIQNFLNYFIQSPYWMCFLEMSSPKISNGMFQPG